jgi:hypothetical protein
MTTGHLSHRLTLYGERYLPDLHAGLRVTANSVHDGRVGPAEGLVVGDEELQRGCMER